jgi:hypothetical protein
MDEAVQVSPKAVTLADIEKLEGALLPLGEDIPIKHTFAPGIYVREGFFRAGIVAIGHQHKTEHVNIVLKGSFSVLEDGAVRQVVAPCIFVSKPGIRKVAFFHEDTIWTNIHPNPENKTEQEDLEKIFITKSDTWLNFHVPVTAGETAQLIQD